MIMQHQALYLGFHKCIMFLNIVYNRHNNTLIEEILLKALKNYVWNFLYAKKCMECQTTKADKAAILPTVTEPKALLLLIVQSKDLSHFPCICNCTHAKQHNRCLVAGRWVKIVSFQQKKRTGTVTAYLSEKGQDSLKTIFHIRRYGCSDDDGNAALGRVTAVIRSSNRGKEILYMKGKWYFNTKVILYILIDVFFICRFKVFVDEIEAK